MPGLIGKKIGMTSVFGADGKNLPCTVIEAGPCVVTQIRTVEKDGYSAVQLAYDETTEKHTSKPLLRLCRSKEALKKPPDGGCCKCGAVSRLQCAFRAQAGIIPL